MAVFRVKADSYCGDEAILAYADRAGMRMFNSAVISAQKTAKRVSRSMELNIK